MNLREACPDTEFSEKFIQGMLDRMAMSFHKYGKVADAYPFKVNAIASLQDRLRLYANGNPSKGIPPGNIEYLMDAANFAMIEFMCPAHPDAHFEATDDSGSPGRISASNGSRDKRDNEHI